MLTGDIVQAYSAGVITTGQARLLWSMIPLAAKILLDYGPDLPDTLIPAAPLSDRLEADFPTARPVLQQLNDRTAQQAPAVAPERLQLFEQVHRCACHPRRPSDDSTPLLFAQRQRRR